MKKQEDKTKKERAENNKRVKEKLLATIKKLDKDEYAGVIVISSIPADRKQDGKVVIDVNNNICICGVNVVEFAGICRSIVEHLATSLAEAHVKQIENDLRRLEVKEVKKK